MVDSIGVGSVLRHWVSQRLVSLHLERAAEIDRGGAARAAHRQLITCRREDDEAPLLHHELGLDQAQSACFVLVRFEREADPLELVAVVIEHEPPPLRVAALIQVLDRQFEAHGMTRRGDVLQVAPDSTSNGKTRV